MHIRPLGQLRTVPSYLVQSPFNARIVKKIYIWRMAYGDS